MIRGFSGVGDMEHPGARAARHLLMQGMVDARDPDRAIARLARVRLRRSQERGKCLLRQIRSRAEDERSVVDRGYEFQIRSGRNGDLGSR